MRRVPLPFQAPPFDKIKDSDYQPAIEAGMTQQRAEVRTIADNPAPPTFENTIVAIEKSGRLFNRVMQVFGGVTGANLSPALAKSSGNRSPQAGRASRRNFPRYQAVPAG
jgi:peptidyl-dipeptidase Dcp